MNERRASLSDEDILAANRVRKQLGAGSCIICLGEKPNVSLLCCGKAVHINCISKWLYDKTSCPQCRGSMEKMERPPATLRDNLSNERPVESSELSSRQSDRERIQRRRWIIEASRTIHPNALRNHVSESSNSSVVNRGRDEQDFNRSGAFRTFGGGNTRSVLHSVTSRQEGNTNSNFETPPRGINGRFSMPSFSITRNGQANPLSPDTQHMGGGNGNTYTRSQTRSVTVTRQEGNTNSNFETPPRRGNRGFYSTSSISITRNGQANPLLSPATQQVRGNGNTDTSNQTSSVLEVRGHSLFVFQAFRR